MRLEQVGRYAAALPSGERALAIQEEVLGKNHPAIAQTLTTVAILHDKQGHPARAEPLFERAVSILETARGPDSPELAQALDNLALSYSHQHQYARALPLHQRALAILEATLGTKHPDVARTRINLAVAWSNQSLHTKAEPLYEQALSIQEESLGRNHPEVARTLNKLGRHYADQGLHEQAEARYRRALDIQQTTLGENHPEVADTLANLARLYSLQGQDARAEPLLLRVLLIRMVSLGKNHPDVAAALNNLANLYSRRGQPIVAEQLYWLALSIQDRELWKGHPDIAVAFNNLAGLYSKQGLPGFAEGLLRQALSIQQAALGPRHPDVARTLDNLGWVLVGQQRLAEAVPLFMQSLSISDEFLRREATGLSESRLTRYLQRLRENEERLYTLLREHPSDAGLQRVVLTTVLLRKGRSVEEPAASMRAIHDSLEAKDRDTFTQWRKLRERLAVLSFGGPGPLPFSEYQQILKELATQGDALEADLARRSARLRELTRRPSVEDLVDRVAAELPRDGALVEWMAYTDRPSQGPGQRRYLAMVLTPDARIQAVDLGPADRIDEAAVQQRAALARRDAHHPRSTARLSSLVVRPVLPLVGQARHLFLAPDGQLGLVPFDALHDGKGFLIERFELSYVNSVSDLLPHPEDAPKSSSVVVFAPSVAPPLGTRSEASHDARYDSARRDDADALFSAPLPGTREEALTIKSLLPQTQVYLGPEATKQRLLEVHSPGLLHIAGHGYYDNDEEPPRGTRALGQFGGMNGARTPPPEDPLLRSGLVLSDARGGHSRVTALELAGLDLRCTQLVVLSACDTGRGDVKPGDGIYGLRRAFAIAGAETVVMSLWKVSDDTTRLLMEDYYRHLRAGKGRSEALHLAMLELRKTHPHPYHWAPFISVGRDGPLRLAPAR
ncbi:CHAT domain-containing tetratricopeptide repeat protein [Pyxidicoccus parkwayensis]|nr:CHAT domain-containing protein [Pyxidicoccus parkwaysis]